MACRGRHRIRPLGCWHRRRARGKLERGGDRQPERENGRGGKRASWMRARRSRVASAMRRSTPMARQPGFGAGDRGMRLVAGARPGSRARPCGHALPDHRRCRPCRTLFIERHGSVSGPSTEKCPSGQKPLDRRVAHDRREERDRDVATGRRSGFLVNTVMSQTGAFVDRPMNERNGMSSVTCSIDWRSERTP